MVRLIDGCTLCASQDPTTFVNPMYGTHVQVTLIGANQDVYRNACQTNRGPVPWPQSPMAAAAVIGRTESLVA